MPLFTFRRSERLKRKKLLQELFRQGDSLAAFPVRLVWLETTPPEKDASLQFAFAVPRRNFPKAIRRNRIKRQLREACRLQKHLLAESLPEERAYAFMLIYISNEELPYRQIEKAVARGFRMFLRTAL